MLGRVALEREELKGRPRLQVGRAGGLNKALARGREVGAGKEPVAAAKARDREPAVKLARPGWHARPLQRCGASPLHAAGVLSEDAQSRRRKARIGRRRSGSCRIGHALQPSAMVQIRIDAQPRPRQKLRVLRVAQRRAPRHPDAALRLHRRPLAPLGYGGNRAVAAADKEVLAIDISNGEVVCRHRLRHKSLAGGEPLRRHRPLPRHDELRRTVKGQSVVAADRADVGLEEGILENKADALATRQRGQVAKVQLQPPRDGRLPFPIRLPGGIPRQPADKLRRHAAKQWRLLLAKRGRRVDRRDADHPPAKVALARGLAQLLALLVQLAPLIKPARQLRVARVALVVSSPLGVCGYRRQWIDFAHARAANAVPWMQIVWRQAVGPHHYDPIVARRRACKAQQTGQTKQEPLLRLNARVLQRNQQ